MRLLVIMFLIIFLRAESFEEYKNSQLRGFWEYKNSLQEAFKWYKEELNREFEEYKKSLLKFWKNPELTTKKRFVEYSKDKRVRKKVDYEKEIIRVDVIAKNKKEARRKIKKALEVLSTQTLKDAFKNNPVLSKINKKLKTKYKSKIESSSLPNELIVGDMIFNKKPTKKEVKTFVNVSLNNPVKVVDSKIKDTKVYTLTVKLPPNSILKKAKKYKSDVFKRAGQFNLTPGLIYAIIHTESYYNPLARSYIPAFGLMQIVPQTAGKDAYKMLYKKERILSPSYLYNSHNNILIGSAYLKLIYYRYFKDIKNPLSRLYCTVAAYNTGVGNVSCAFNSKERDYKGRIVCKKSRGDYNIQKALSLINSMTSKEVYYYLIKNLRYDEARNYLKKVTSRYIFYLHSLKNNQI